MTDDRYLSGTAENDLTIDPEYPDEVVEATNARIDAARSVLTDLGFTPDATWSFPRAGKRATTDRASFQHLAVMPDAPHLLALFQAYAETVGLEVDGNEWAMSALPRFRNTDLIERGATISIGVRETFYVDVIADGGRVAWWGAVIDSKTAAPEGTDAKPSDWGGTIVEGDDLRSLLMALNDGDFETALRDTHRARAHQKRRSDSFNPWLANLVVPGNQAQSPSGPSSEVEHEVARRYVERIVRQRLHQRDFKLLLLRTYPAECTYCGLAVREVLDAAHLVADSDGGRASADNGRLLCANHHRAFDAGLLEWTGATFVPAEGAPSIPPLKRTLPQ